MYLPSTLSATSATRTVANGQVTKSWNILRHSWTFVLLSRLMTEHTRPREDFLTPAELAARWKLSVKTIRRRYQNGDIPYTRLPGERLIRFAITDIEAQEAQRSSKCQ